MPSRARFVPMRLCTWPCSLQLHTGFRSAYGKRDFEGKALCLGYVRTWVMVRVSYRSHRVSNFHSSRSTATKNCLMPCSSGVTQASGTDVRFQARLCISGMILLVHRPPGQATVQAGRS